MGFSTNWLVVLPISLTSIPAAYFLNQSGAMEHPLFVLVAGVVLLTIVALIPAVIMIMRGEKSDPFFYVLSIFTFSSVIDLVIALENDGVISSFMTFYLMEGEEYLKTAHGTMILYWDGVAHLIMYILIIYAQSNGKSYKEVGLYWAGSIGHSMIVFIPGNIVVWLIAACIELTFKLPYIALEEHYLSNKANKRKFGIKWSILLNIPYFIIPFWAGYRFLKMDNGAQKGDSNYKPSSIWRRPLDVIFILFLEAAIGLACFRGLTVLGCNSEYSQTLLNYYEPYLKDDSSYPKIQMIVYMFYYVPYYVAAICGLWSGPSQSWMVDWSLIHAGAAAQGQFSYLGAAIRHSTDKKYRIPTDPNIRLVFFLLNGALFLIPQLLAMRCLFGRPGSQQVSPEKVNSDAIRVKKKKHFKLK